MTDFAKLREKLHDLISKDMKISEQQRELQTKINELEQESEQYSSEEIAILEQLFQEDEHYHCPACHQKMELVTSEDKYELNKYYLTCPTCNIIGPAAGNQFTALLKWYNFCNRVHKGY